MARFARDCIGQFDRRPLFCHGDYVSLSLSYLYAQFDFQTKYLFPACSANQQSRCDGNDIFVGVVKAYPAAPIFTWSHIVSSDFVASLRTVPCCLVAASCGALTFVCPTLVLRFRFGTDQPYGDRWVLCERWLSRSSVLGLGWGAPAILEPQPLYALPYFDFVRSPTPAHSFLPQKCRWSGHVPAAYCWGPLPPMVMILFLLVLRNKLALLQCCFCSARPWALSVGQFVYLKLRKQAVPFSSPLAPPSSSARLLDCSSLWSTDQIQIGPQLARHHYLQHLPGLSLRCLHVQADRMQVPAPCGNPSYWVIEVVAISRNGVLGASAGWLSCQ